MTLERILLQTIKFDLQVEHPYGYLLKYAKCLKGETYISFFSGIKQVIYRDLLMSAAERARQL